MAKDKFRRSRNYKEGKLAAKLAKLLGLTKKRIIQLLKDNPAINLIDDLFWEEQAAEMLPILNESLVLAGSEAIDVELSEIAFLGIDIAEANREVTEFIADYSYDLVKGINATSKRTIQAALDSFFAGTGTTIGEVQAQLVGTFGASRAESIAVTEITRAYSAGQDAVISGLVDIGLESKRVWNTNNDELVCETCGPLNDKVTNETPPAHPRCRCWLTIELRDKKKALEILMNSLMGE